MIVQFYCFQICLDSFIAWTGGRPAGFSCDMEISYLISFSDVGCSLHVLGLLHLFRVCFFVRAHLMSHIMFDELHRERTRFSHIQKGKKRNIFSLQPSPTQIMHLMSSFDLEGFTLRSYFVAYITQQSFSSFFKYNILLKKARKHNSIINT